MGIERVWVRCRKEREVRRGDGIGLLVPVWRCEGEKTRGIEGLAKFSSIGGLAWEALAKWATAKQGA